MKKTIHALIIGINAYPSRPLFGCVNDALAVGRFFKEFCDVPENNFAWNPRYLLAPHPEGEANVEQAVLADPAVADRQLPLRANVIEAFKHLYSQEVKPDDICLVYYSGHGALEPAAPEFADLEPDGMNETFVCLDSRETGNRDLLDKEFAWLISNVKNRVADGHLLVITDSCHSGGATRSSDDTTRDRRESATDIPTPFQELLGVAGVPESEWIFTVADNKAFYKYEAKHIQLAASRDSETAKETSLNGQQHGIFTWNLLRVLGAGGSALSYRELMRRTEVLVRTMVSNQLPQLHAFAGAKRSESFLGGGIAPAKVEYPVVYQKPHWQLKAGALNGIVLDPSKKQPTIVRLADGREVRVEQVFANYSLLDASKFTEKDAATLVFDQRATIQQMPATKISIYAAEAAMPEGLYADLKKAETQLMRHYCALNAPSEAEADFHVAVDDAGNYMLVRKGSNYPVFKRQANAFDFLDFCESVGRWRFVQEMGKASFDGFSMDDLDISLEVLSDIDPATINTAKGEAVSMDNVTLTYFPPDETGREKVPALRCTVRLKKSGFWIGGLYLDNEFGIHPFLDVRQDKNKEAHEFTYQDDGQSYTALPLLIDPIRLKQGVREITEYLKIYISNKDFSLADFEQNSLPLDDQPITRSIGFGRGIASAPDWMVVTIPVTIKAASTTVALKSMSGAGFTVSGLSDGFEAKAAVASLSEVTTKLQNTQTDRGMEIELQKFVIPPAGLWGESMEESVVFSNSLDGAQSQSVSVMELTEVKGKLTEPFYLNLDNPCTEDEVIVAYGYDADAESYFPIGLSLGNDRVEMLAIPTETPGRIQGEEEGFTGKDAGGSIKMFFKKLIRKQNPNTLAMVNPDLSRVTDIGEVRTAVAKARRILVVTHGFVGDTDKIAEAMMQKTKIHESYDVVFAFDFENLNTPLQDTAQDFFDRLKDAGVFNPEMGRRLTVLGSSMGGIMCRWMVEKNQEITPFVEHLFLVAAPNLGTDISSFRKRLFALIGKALSGVAAFKPYLLPLSIVAKKADKELWVTLNQMDPDKSEFLKKLNENSVLSPEIMRSMIGGNVKDMTLKNHNRGKFFKRLKRFVMKTFMDWFVFEGEHDLINPLKSQKGAPWMKPEEMVILPVDHMSYYYEEESLKALEKALTKGQVVAEHIEV
jgi:pimeloyl-ACP methyl ester carboxylesterase